jgi:hypothetical protein
MDIMKTTYKNRYGDIFIFELQENGNILWTGNFQYCRFGMPNDYTRAYNQYVQDNKHVQSLMSFNQFKKAVHDYDDETHQYIYDKYIKMVDSLKDKISMIDPSGGPYISTEMDMKYINNDFAGMIVKDFEQTKDGYLIIIKK